MHFDHPHKTQQLASSLAAELLAQMPGRHSALVVGLVGDLGAGKTTFMQGFARGLGIGRTLPSPTFVLMRRYEIAHRKSLIANRRASSANRLALIHMDAYRIKDISELKHLDFKNLLADPSNLVCIEWADNIWKALPKSTKWIYFSHGETDSLRHIDIK